MDIFPDQLQLEGTAIPVPDNPGLGITIVEDAIQTDVFEFWEPPRLSKKDGSYTNW